MSSLIRLAAVLACSLAIGVADAEELQRRGMIGVQLAPLTADLRTTLQFQGSGGVLISGIIPGLPAEKAGLKSNDIITAVGELPVDGPPALSAALRPHGAGQTVSLSVWREGATKILQLTLGERPRETSEKYDVTYDATRVGEHLVRTLVTRPKADGRRPAVLVLPGLPNQPGEFPPQPRVPFRPLVEALSDAGFVTMRVDRPGVGDSQGVAPEDAPISSDVATIAAAVAALADYEFVDPKRVFVFAHGLAGTVLPLAMKDAPVAGVIVYGTLARPPAEALPELYARYAELDAASDEDVQRTRKDARAFFAALCEQCKSPVEVFKSEPALRETIGPSVRDDTYLLERHYRFVQELSAAPISESWRSVRVPVLAMWGECDFQAGRADHEQIVEWVNASHPGRAKLAVIEGADHLFQSAEDAEESYLSGFTGQYNDAVFAAVCDWLKAQAGGASQTP